MRVLDERSVDADPVKQLQAWLHDAGKAGYLEPNAMMLATVDAQARPSARIVLLRRLDDRGLVFFTNYDSRKGREIYEHGNVAAVFYWDQLQRQVRVEGVAARVESAESDDYFAHRPRGHRIGAWASPQSTVVPNRAFLEDRFAAVEREYEGRDVDRPPNWGGLRIVPERFEFWQGRDNRIHDRIAFVRNGAAWKIERLAP